MIQTIILLHLACFSATNGVNVVSIQREIPMDGEEIFLIRQSMREFGEVEFRK